MSDDCWLLLGVAVLSVAWWAACRMRATEPPAGPSAREIGRVIGRVERRARRATR